VPLAAPDATDPTPALAGQEDVRVVLVDDSAVVRHVVSEAIRRAPGLALAGSATDGCDAVAVVATAHPHVVVLDVEMPVLDGLGALRELKQRWPTLPVVMFSTLTERGAAATLQALAEGADDYLTKPISATGPAGALSAVSENLVPLLLAWGSIARKRQGRPEPRGGPGGPAPMARELPSPKPPPAPPEPAPPAAAVAPPRGAGDRELRRPGALAPAKPTPGAQTPPALVARPT
jgi:two-component system chemotaxis response regulator CheB